MNFGQAIEAMKAGQCVHRSGWNGKGMFIFYGEVAEIKATAIRKMGQVYFQSEPVIVMYTATGTLQPGWVASQPDMLAEDWEVKSF